MDGALKAAIGAIAAVFLLTLISLAGILLVLTGGGASLTGENGGSGGSGSAVNCIPDTSPIGTPDPTATPINNGCGPGEVPAPLPSGGLVGFTKEVSDAIIAAAAKYGLDPCFLGALAMQESGGDPNAKSADGGYGLFQITPGNGQSFSTDLQTNVNAGAAHIANDIKVAGGNVQQGLILYNCGGCKGDPNFTTGRRWPGNPPPDLWPPGTKNHYPGSCVINGTTCLSYPDSVMKFQSQVCPAPAATIPTVGYLINSINSKTSNYLNFLMSNTKKIQKNYILSFAKEEIA